MSQVTLPGSGGTVTFKYDPFGRRIQKVSSAGTTNYVYDGANTLEEVDGSGGLLARYSQGLGLDEQLFQLRSGEPSFYQADGLGSITSLSNVTAQLANTATYSSFGLLTSSMGGWANPFQYTGRDFDVETSLLDLRARYFDPRPGRFLSEDPIRFVGGIDFYRYVENNPVRYGDQTGKADPSAIALGGSLVGAAGSEGGVAAGAIAGVAGGAAVIGAGAAGWFTGRLIGNLPLGNGQTIDDAVTNAFTKGISWYRNRNNPAKCSENGKGICEQLYEDDMAQCEATFLSPDNPDIPGFEACAARALLNLERCLEWAPGIPPRTPIP